MASYNKILLMGNLCRDVELSYIPSGTALGKTCLAVNETWKKDGEKKERVTFVNLTVWGKRAETLAQYTQKGDPLFIEGRLQIDKVEKDEGNRYYTKVVVENFQFLKRRGDRDGGGASLPSTSSGLPEADGAFPGSDTGLPEVGGDGGDDSEWGFAGEVGEGAELPTAAGSVAADGSNTEDEITEDEIPW